MDRLGPRQGRRRARGCEPSSLVLIALLVMGCYSPQRPGAARTTYLTMVTADGAFLGGLGGVITCGIATGGLSHNAGESKAAIACGIGGLVFGGAGALYGSATSDDEPTGATWITVSLLPGILAFAAIIGTTRWVIGKIRAR